MKKNVVYSLAALSAIPVATSAAPADVSTIDLIQSKWQGTGLNYDNNGTVVISPSGDPIEQAVGKLQQGSYVFKYNFIETDGSDIIIEVGGVTTTIEAANTDMAAVSFILLNIGFSYLAFSLFRSGTSVSIRNHFFWRRGQLGSCAV